MNNSIMYYELYNIKSYTVKHKKTERQKKGKCQRERAQKRVRLPGLIKKAK